MSSRRKSADNVLVKRKVDDMEIEEEGNSLPPLSVVKEELDELEELEKVKDMAPRPRGRTRSLTKKPFDKADIKAKLERSRQSARECRARKKLRYQYLEEIISESEKAIFKLRKELDTLKIWARQIDEGVLPDNVLLYKQQVEAGRMGGKMIDQRMDQNFYLQEMPQPIQQQQQPQQLAISPTTLGAALPPMTGLSLSPNTGTLELSPNAFFQLGLNTGSNPVLSSSLT